MTWVSTPSELYINKQKARIEVKTRKAGIYYVEERFGELCRGTERQHGGG